MRTLVRLLFFLLILSSFSCIRKSGRKQKDTIKSPMTELEQRKQSRIKKIGDTSDSLSNISNQDKITGSEIFSKYNSAVFMIFTSDGQNTYQGSGFFVSSSGIAVSNYHVFEGTNQGQEIILLSNGEQYKIKRVISKSSENDNILFEVNNRGDTFNYIPIERGPVKVGEKVYAIGSPKGLENTFSSGEISGIRSSSLYQISVPITHGSSGGALINEYGKVIGITTSGLAEAGAILNFAININTVKF